MRWRAAPATGWLRLFPERVRAIPQRPWRRRPQTASALWTRTWIAGLGTLEMPFTAAQFFDLFATYNRTLWPVVAVLWVTTVVLTVQLVRGRADTRALTGLAAAHWAWSGGVYHALFFTRINPAAWLFAAIFLGQAALLIWYGVARRGLTLAGGRSLRHVAGEALLAYSLLYPLLIWLDGTDLPRAPIFAVPCPTVLWTSGLLLMVAPPPRLLMLAPLVWAVIGGSAAFLFGVAPDLMLFGAAACLVTYGARTPDRKPAWRRRETPSTADRRAAVREIP